MVKRYNLSIYTRLVRISRFVIFVLITAQIISLWFLHDAIRKEEAASSEVVQLIDLGHQLQNLADFLTDEVRKFVVTTNPVHLQRFWHEIEVAKRREQLISRLGNLKAEPIERNYLSTAKRISDTLISTEIRGMKLALMYFDVPEDKMPKAIQAYQLSAYDLQLPRESKLALARQIMFDARYEQTKKQIVANIEKFNKTVRGRKEKAATIAKEKVDTSMRAAIIIAVLKFFMFAALIWFLHRQKVHERYHLMKQSQSGGS